MNNGKKYIWVVSVIDTDPDKAYSEQAVSFWETKEDAFRDVKNFLGEVEPDEYDNGLFYDFGSMSVYRREIGVPWS